MSDPLSNPALPGIDTTRRTGNAVLCAECERLNPLGLKSCDRCGVDLFIACNHCGAESPRTSTRCAQCGQRRGESPRRSQTKPLWNNPLYWAVAVLGLGIAMAMILLVWLGNGHLPRI